jgi:hypothetical protein
MEDRSFDSGDHNEIKDELDDIGTEQETSDKFKEPGRGSREPAGRRGDKWTWPSFYTIRVLNAAHRRR